MLADKRAITEGRWEEAITSSVSSGFLYESGIETTTSYLFEAIPASTESFERDKSTRFLGE